MMLLACILLAVSTVGCAGMTPEQMTAIGVAVTDAANGAVDAYIRLEEVQVQNEPTPEEVAMAQQIQIEKLRAYVELLRSLGLGSTAEIYETNVKVLTGEAGPTYAESAEEAQPTAPTTNVNQSPAPVKRE